MGMTIADNIDFLNEVKKVFEDIANNPSINETVKTYLTIESLESAIDTMRKYQLMQTDYNARLKADMLAMLTEIQLEIEELDVSDVVPEYQDGAEETREYIANMIEEKINSLKENTDGANID